MRAVLPFAVLGVVLAWVPLAFALRGVRAGRRGGLRDRAGAVEGLVSAAAAVVVAHQLVPWESVPALLWALPVAAAALGAVTSALAWPSLPVLAGPRPGRRAVGAGSGVVVGLALLALMLLG